MAPVEARGRRRSVETVALEGPRAAVEVLRLGEVAELGLVAEVASSAAPASAR